MKRKYYKFASMYLFPLIVFCIAFLSFVWANTLSITSWDVYTWKYFCDVKVPVIVNYDGGSWFGNCQFWLKFDSYNITWFYDSRWSNFTKTNKKYITWSNNDILYVDESNEYTIITETSVCSNLIFRTTSTAIPSTTIQFVEEDWNLPTAASFLNVTNSWLNVSYNGEDTLTGVQNLTINYEICPCTLDTVKPTFSDFSPNISNTNLTGLQTISFLIYDQWWTPWNYWSQWQPVSLSNYTWVGVPSGMDNQEWINSGSITVTIHYDSRYWVADETLTLANWRLHIQRYTWTKANTPAYTWDGNDRWYWVSFTPSTWFLPEYLVTITIAGSDNALNNWAVCSSSSNSRQQSYTINNPVKPTISLTSPANNTSNLNPSVSDLVFRVADTWAWVDTWTVRITIPAIYSWSQLLMTWYTYSWSELEFSNCSWTPEIGWKYSCDVTIHPKWSFPVAKTVRITWYVADLAGNSSNVWSWQISTRQDCSFYGCINYVQIFTWVFESIPVVEFTWSLIVVTGTMLPYPMLTWENNNILMCGPTDTEINLTWTINIYSGDVVINGTTYEGTGLYITGLNFEYEDWVITVLY